MTVSELVKANADLVLNSKVMINITHKNKFYITNKEWTITTVNDILINKDLGELEVYNFVSNYYCIDVNEEVFLINSVINI